MNIFIFFAILIMVPNGYSHAQDATIYTSDPCPLCQKNGKSVVLIDNNTGTKFILDSTRTFIKAINDQEKIIWTYEVLKDSSLSFFPGRNLTVIQFCFRKDSFTGNNVVIWILTSNGDVGFINKANGKFTYLATDGL